MLLVTLVIGTAIWVGFDARGRVWADCWLAKDTTGWVLGCLLLWILFFPAYLALRGQHPKRLS